MVKTCLFSAFFGTPDLPHFGAVFGVGGALRRPNHWSKGTPATAFGPSQGPPYPRGRARVSGGSARGSAATFAARDFLRVESRPRLGRRMGRRRVPPGGPCDGPSDGPTAVATQPLKNRARQKLPRFPARNRPKPWRGPWGRGVPATAQTQWRVYPWTSGWAVAGPPLPRKPHQNGANLGSQKKQKISRFSPWTKSAGLK